MYRFIVLLPFLLLLQLKGMASDPDIDKGWEHFAKNELSEARDAFKKALKGSEKHNAALALSLVAAAEGDTDAESFKYYYQYYKTAPQPLHTIEAMWSLHTAERTDDELDFLEEIVKNTKGTLKSKANQSLGNHYRNTTKTKKAQKYFDAIGAVETWQVVGEFENISESGFDKDHGPLQHPEQDHRFINKRGINVQWFDLPQPRYDKWVDFSYHFYISNSIIYAQNFCYSPKEQEVQFRIGTSGSLKCWVNDQELFSEAEERNNWMDTYIFTVKLEKGYNRILLQLGSSEISASNFLLRITNDEGESLEDLEFTTQLQDYPKDTYSYTSTVPENETEAYFQQQLEEHPDALVNYLVLTQMYLTNDMVYKAKKLLKEAKKRFPDCSYITFQLIQANYQEGSRNTVSTYVEELKQKDPESMLAREIFFNKAMETEDFAEAKKILAKIEWQEGNSKNVYTKKIELASESEKSEETIGLIEEAYSKYPEEPNFVYLKYLIEKKVENKPNAAAWTIKKYLKNHYNEDLLWALSSHYLSVGDANNALQNLNVLLEYNPIATGYLSYISSIYFTMRNFSQSEQLLEKCIKIAPYVGSYYATMATNYADMGNEKKAEEFYNKAIYYDPYDYDARQKLQMLRNEGDIFEQFKEEDVYGLYESAPGPEDYPEDKSVVLLDEVKKVVYSGGGSEEQVIMLVKMLNSDGIDAWKEYYIPVYGNQEGMLVKAEVLKSDGSRLEATNSGSHVVFPSLEVGDAIYLNYKVKNYYSGKLTDHFWDKFHFNYSYPVLTARYSLLLPANKQFQHKLVGADMEPAIEELGDNKLYVWEMNDLESLKYESYMPSLADVGIVLHLSSINNWDFIAEWYAELAESKAKEDYELKETVNALFEGKEGLSDKEKVLTIYDYIVENIRYSSVSFIQSGLVPQKASSVISAKQGDCKDVSTLFVAMCKAMGIDAHLVLINTRDNGRQALSLPSIEFNHCIASVDIEGQPYYVELTGDNLPFSTGTYSITDAFMLEIDNANSGKAEPQYLHSPRWVENKVVREGSLSFDGAKMIVEKKNTKMGSGAHSMRHSYENEGENGQFKNMQEAINYDHGNAVLTKVSFEDNLYTNEPTVDYTYTYSINDVFTELSDLQIFEIPWGDSWNAPDFLSYTDRKFPVELWRYFTNDQYEESLTIEVPSGKRLSEVPENVSISNKYFTYSMEYSLSGNKLTVSRKFNLLGERVSVEDYAAFKSMFNQLLKADKQSLAFK